MSWCADRPTPLAAWEANSLPSWFGHFAGVDLVRSSPYRASFKRALGACVATCRVAFYQHDPGHDFSLVDDHMENLALALTGPPISVAAATEMQGHLLDDRRECSGASLLLSSLFADVWGQLMYPNDKAGPAFARALRCCENTFRAAVGERDVATALCWLIRATVEPPPSFLALGEGGES